MKVQKMLSYSVNYSTDCWLQMWIEEIEKVVKKQRIVRRRVRKLRENEIRANIKRELGN